MDALQDIRVIDLGTFVAGPVCTTFLAEFGADVIKVEPPGAGDSLRRLGTDTDCGDTLWWLSESRNKRCVSIDLATEKGRDLVKRLVATCDVLVENFRPGVVEKWGLGWEEVHALNPRAVMVRISGYGQTGPYSSRPGFARVAHAFSGLSYLCGQPGEVPVVPGSTSLADYMSALYAAYGAMVALNARRLTGQGQLVDLALYEPPFRTLDEMVSVYERDGTVRERMGPDTVNVCPHSHYPSKDGEWVAIACSNDLMFARLCDVMRQPELAAPERFAHRTRRFEHREEVNRIVAAWTLLHDARDILARCNEAGVPASLIYSVREIAQDPQYAWRENIVRIPSRAGEIAVPNVVPTMSLTPGRVRWAGPAVGEHNDQVFGDLLGLSAEELASLRGGGVI